MNGSLLVRIVAVVAIGFFISGCGGSSGGDGPPPAGPSDPSATVVPANGSLLAATSVITITFDRAMDASTLALDGSLLAKGSNLEWSNDRTVAITRAVRDTWPDGPAKQLVVDCRDLNGAALPTLTLTYDVDAVAPTLTTVSPANNSYIGNTDPITLQFSESMDPTSLSMIGTLEAESDGGTWATTTYMNDTLVLTPATVWSDNASHVMRIFAADVAGNSSVGNQVNYMVDTVVPTASAIPASGGYLNTAGEIAIQFSESMDTASLSLGGTLAAASDGGIWSTAGTTNDTLTLLPSTTWPEGAGRTLTVDAADLAGHALATLTLSLTVDATQPAVVSGPATGAVLANTETVVVQFSETMDTASVTVSGELAGGGVSAVWTQTAYANDTLSLTPVGQWPVGRMRRLQIEGADLAGNPLNFWYRYLDVATVYVDATNGDDTWIGDSVNPVQTLSKGKELAVARYTTSELHIKDGNYTVAEPFLLVEGVSMYGGYDLNNWGIRDPHNSGASVVCIYNFMGYSQQPVATFEARSGVTNATVVDGFRLWASSQPNVAHSAGIFLKDGGAPVLRNIDVYGSSATETSYGVFIFDNTASGSAPVLEDSNIRAYASKASYGLFNYRSNIVLRRNYIAGGTASAGTSYGIYSSQSNVTIAYNRIDAGSVNSPSGTTGLYHGGEGHIYNNTVYGGTNAAGTTIGVSLGSGQPAVRNNTIDAGYGARSYAVLLNTNSNPYLDNNILLSPATIRGYCILEATDSADPLSLRNNDFFDCSSAWYADYVGSGGSCADLSSTDCYSDPTGVNDYTHTTQNALAPSSGNISADPVFLNRAMRDYHLRTSSPVSVTAGGLDGGGEGWVYADDKDHGTRTVPWSIGAYEAD